MLIHIALKEIHLPNLLDRWCRKYIDDKNVGPLVYDNEMLRITKSSACSEGIITRIAEITQNNIMNKKIHRNVTVMRLKSGAMEDVLSLLIAFSILFSSVWIGPKAGRMKLTRKVITT